MEKATAQERVGQFLFVVGGDDHHGTMHSTHSLAGLVNVKLHPVEFLQQIVRKLDIGLVHFVNQQNHAGRGGERLPQLARLDIVAHIVDAGISQLAVAQPADGVIFIQALLRLCR